MFGLVPFGSKKNNEVARREDGFHSLFDIFNEPFFTNPFAGFGDMGMPASMRVDVKDNGSSYELTADLPGMEKKDISRCRIHMTKVVMRQEVPTLKQELVNVS